MLNPANIRCDVDAGSKKRALDLLSEMLAEGTGLSPADVLEGLASRERLGSTALGGAVAMPHARVAGLESGTAAFIKLNAPVEFDAPDGGGVDLLLGLLVPDIVDSDGAELAELARRLDDPALLERLRLAEDAAALRAELIERLAPAPIASTDD